MRGDFDNGHVQPPMVDVMVPGAWSPDGLATTLASLASQRYPAFRITVARPPLSSWRAADGVSTILEAHGHRVRRYPVPRGATAAARRQILLDRTDAPYVLVVEDGVYLEPDLLGRLVAAIRAARCGVVGSAVVDLRYQAPRRVDDEVIEFWDGPVRAEDVRVGTRAWRRRRLHHGATLEYLRERLPRTRDRLYRIADIHGCVLYDRPILTATGGFEVAAIGEGPPVGVEAMAQLRVLGRAGGAGLFPSGAYRIVGPIGVRSDREGGELFARRTPGSPARPRHAAETQGTTVR